MSIDQFQKTTKASDCEALKSLRQLSVEDLQTLATGAWDMWH